jgi:hypothetical protein
MKPLNMTLMGVAATLVLSAAPISIVHAQSALSEGVDTTAVVGASGNWTLKEREHWLYNRLDMARDDGAIDREQYDGLHATLDGLRDRENAMRDAHEGQLTDNETASLELKLDGVADEIQSLHDGRFQRPW